MDAIDFFNNNILPNLLKIIKTVAFLICTMGFYYLGERLSKWKEVEATFHHEHKKLEIMGVLILYSSLSLGYWGFQGWLLLASSSPIWLWLIILMVIPLIFYTVLLNETIAY